MMDSGETFDVDQKMLDLGRTRFRSQVQSALQGHRRATVGGGKLVLRAAARVTVDLVRKRMDRRGPGRAHAALPYLKKLSPEQATYIALRTMIDQLADLGDVKLTRLACQIGGRVEDEVRFKAFKREDPKRFKRFMEKAGKTNSYRRKERVLVHGHRLSDESSWESWGSRINLLIGTFLIDAALEATGVFEVATVPVRGRGRRTVKVIRLTEQAVDMIQRKDQEQELLRPWFLPTVNEPVPWTKPWGGGYGDGVRAMQLVKTHNKWYFETLKQATMPKVYEAINSLQSTPWSINEDVLVVAEELWKSRSGIAGLPQQDPLPKPVRPEWLSNDTQVMTREERTSLSPEHLYEFKGWKIQCRQVYATNARMRSQVVATTKILLVADMYRHFSRFYFPHQLDWRGRAYAVPLFLNPQGNDLARGLLRFEKGVALGRHGAFWLAVHGANSFGEDKVSLEDRVDWVNANEQAILAVAEDPLENRWWAEADAPFQFLAFCLEWAAYVASGYSASFESRLVVSLDGSCNGLQHYSAMLRDSQGAAATNLTTTADSDRPSDVYQRVADRVKARLAEAAGRGGVEAILARQWVDSGLVDRAFVKRQVMTLPYGVSRHGMENQLVEHCRKEGIDLFALFEDVFAARRYFIAELWTAIEEVVRAAPTAMKYLQGVARAAAKEGLPLVWLSPSGFPVRQHYPSMSATQVRTMILGRMVKFTLQDPVWSKLDRRKQVDGAAPNFVHSLDAAHMVFTVVGTEGYVKQPLSWCMVHDSYGTHAGFVEAMGKVLRRTFVDLYQDDVLALFHRGVAAMVRGDLPEPPPRGAFDLSQVLGANYFFA